ncbi:MAG: SGNH/GDSL hydrolase family protein, partial [Acidimicrobiales bacterium]
NQAIWAASRRWPNLTVADWAATLAAHPGYEYPDQVHLKPEGSALLATFIRQQLDAWFDGPDRTYSATFGGAPALGGGGWVPPSGSVIGAAPDAGGGGLWAADSRGGVYSLGNAGFYGSAAGQRLSAPVVGMAATPDGRGYWLVGADGGVFSFGDAGFYGSTASSPLAAPVVGITPTPTGHGYWLVGADGGVFSFGDAPFEGAGHDQVGPDQVKASYAALVTAPSGGYWLVGQAPALAYAPAASTTAAPGTLPPAGAGPLAKAKSHRRPASRRASRASRAVTAAGTGLLSRPPRSVAFSVGLGSVLILAGVLFTLLRGRRRRAATRDGADRV